MKIYLSPHTAGRGGGSLKGNLRHLNRHIQTTLNNSDFKCSFDELWLTLSYPPMYVLPGVVGIEREFMKNYNTFPYSRLNRRYKKIDIVLKAPEFSEHFDKEEQVKYLNKFEIEQQFENIEEAELGKILIDKYLEAAEIINSKIKREDSFDYGIFKQILNSIKEKINAGFLEIVNASNEKEASNDTLKRAIEFREKRKHQEKPKDKLIRDLRVYCDTLPIKALSPYDYQYTEIFLNLLVREQLMCPTYHHLYIQVAQTVEQALKNTVAIEHWYVNGIAVIDFEKYKTLTEKQKEETVFETIVAGLKDIATIDKLDLSKINNVVTQIKEKGLNTELLFRKIENSKFSLRITYLSRSMEEECPIFFNLTDKTSNITKRKQIGKADKFQIYFWLQKITLTNKLIKVKSSNSIRGIVWLKNKPSTMEFNIAEFMK